MIALPHTAGCVVCGRENLHGLQLNLFVDPASGLIRTTFTPGEYQLGFQGIAHGGMLATVVDEAMVWAASWPAAHFCYAAEMTIRFRKPAVLGVPLIVEAQVIAARSKLISTTATMKTPEGVLIAESSGKYIPMPDAMDREVKKTLIPEPASAAAMVHLQKT